MIRYFWPAYLWGVIVLILTGIPGNDLPTIPSYLEVIHPDKIVHMGMFGLLMLLLSAGSYYKAGKVSISNKLIFIYFIITASLGGITELLQKWVFVGRSCDILDFFADVVGVILALLFYFFVFESKKQRVR
ncbi:MAG: VanZ family protein [Bacteroidota bacterium]|nr:VanZ family protein [Bacteroidota bacterium]